MSTRARRRLAITVAGVAAVACALTAPASAAYASSAGYTPNSHQWYFSKWGIQQQVWPTTEGAGVTVAVVDSGVQAIPDLQGALMPGGDMLGDPGNGEKDYAPDGGHGTAVAALIAGQGVNGGPVGIAPQAKILPVHVAYPANDISTSLPQGIKYAVNHGANVINISLGQPSGSALSCDPPLQQAISYALAHNVVVVAGSGDTNLGGPGPIEPASCAGVLAVGGVEPNGSLWPDSTQGLDVSVAAPGDHLYTAGDDGVGVSYTSNGTSFSAPLVSAAVALIRAKYPSMPWYTIDQRLTATAVPSGHVPNSGVGFGIINISKALNVSRYPVSSSSPNPTYTRYQHWLQSTGQSASAGGSQTSSGKSGGSSIGLIIGIVAGVLIIAAVLIIILATRGRSRRGPRAPGGYPPNAHAPGPQYPQVQYPPPGGQYPQPGQYAPPGGGQYPPPGQYPAPGQYPPPAGQQDPRAPYQPGQQHPAQPGPYPPPHQ